MGLEILKKFDFSKYMDKYNMLARAYNEKAEALMLSGRYEEAMEPEDMAIKLYKTIPNHYPIFAVANKAFLLWRKGGHAECREASNICEEALTWQKEALGSDHVAYK